MPTLAFQGQEEIGTQVVISSSRGQGITMRIIDFKQYDSILSLCEDTTIPMLAVVPNALSRRDMSHKCAMRLARFRNKGAFSSFYALRLRHI